MENNFNKNQTDKHSLLNILKGFFFRVKNYIAIAFYEVLERCILLVSELSAFADDFVLDFKKLKNKSVSLFQYLRLFFGNIKNHHQPFATLFNYLVPIILTVVTISTVKGEFQKVYALEVNYNGSVIGDVKNESVFQNAVSMVGGILMQDDETQNFVSVPCYKLVEARPSELSNSDMIAEEVIEKSSGTFENASGLFLDGEFVSAAKNASDIRTVLDKIESLGKIHFNADDVEIYNDIEIKNGLYPSDDILDIEDFSKNLTGESMSVLRQGQYSSNGTISLKITKLENYTKSIPFETKEIQDSSILAGSERVITEGKYGAANVKELSVYIDGRKSESTILEMDITEQPVKQELLVGVRLPEDARGLANQYGHLFCSPISGGYVSSAFMTIERPTHRGIDLAIAEGSNVFATNDGIVIHSGWSDDGAGLNVIIDHNNGFTTRYAHCSALYVENGDTVTKGQIIAAVGMTGNATGNHVHYEIKYNGYQVDPWPFIAG